MVRAATDLLRRSRSLRTRIDALSGLRATVALRPESDITARQWRVLESQLASVSARLSARVTRGARAYLPAAHTPAGARALNALLGELELELSRAFEFFDTYMDVLTQRHTPEMGRLLAGCDALAWDCLKRDHPALDIIEPSLTYCDRGFGASTLREGVLLPHAIPNPMPLIEIPYSRLKEKCNLTSVLHEAGHEAMVRLGLTRTLPLAMREGLAHAGASRRLQDLFALWSRETGPDFWGFCSSGVAAVATLREILALPPPFVFRVSWTDPHPPPYVRVLLSLECCRQTWGQGEWDAWEQQWLDLYPMERLPASMRALLGEARRCLPVVTHILLRTRFGVLNGRALPELFDLPALAPATLQRIARTLDAGPLRLIGLRPCTQLAVFRTIKERGRIDDETLDRLMTTWLIRLGAPRKDSR
jgi:hypothetical protein